MKKQLWLRQKLQRLTFSFAVFLFLVVALNLVAWPFAPPSGVFWHNPLMEAYPVGGFDSRVTVARRVRSSATVLRCLRDDRRGYRPDPEPAIPEQGRVVLHLGDSSTWGWGLQDRRDAYPTAISRWLPSDVTSVNLGVPGYTSLQGLRYLEEVLPQCRGRVAGVTLYFGNNDATVNAVADEELLPQLARQAHSFWWRLPLYRWLVQLRPPPVVGGHVPRVSPMQSGANLRQMVALARTYGIPVAVIMPPVPLSWPPGYRTCQESLAPRVDNALIRRELTYAGQCWSQGEALFRAFDDAYHVYWAEALEHDWVLPRIKSAWRGQIQAVCVELDAPLVEFPVNADPVVLSEVDITPTFVDYCHPSTYTHAAMAERIVKAFGR